MKAKRRLLIVGIVIGSLLTLSPLPSMLCTVFGMIRAFNELGSSGNFDKQALSDSISTALVGTTAGLCLFPVGVIVLTLSLVFFFRLRAPSPPPVLQKPIQ